MLLAQITAKVGTCTQVLEVEMGEDLKVMLRDDQTDQKKGSSSEPLFLIPLCHSPPPFPSGKKQQRSLTVEMNLSMLSLPGCCEMRESTRLTSCIIVCGGVCVCVCLSAHHFIIITNEILDL